MKSKSCSTKWISIGGQTIKPSTKGIGENSEDVFRFPFLYIKHVVQIPTFTMFTCNCRGLLASVNMQDRHKMAVCCQEPDVIYQVNRLLSTHIL